MASATQVTKLLQEAIQRIVSKTSYDNWFRHSVKFVTAGDGACVAEMTIGEEHVNSRNHLHGGCTASLVDMVTAVALGMTGTTGTAVNLSISYLKGARLGEVIVLDAKTLRAGKNLAFLSVEIRKKEDGSLIAIGKNVKFVGQSTA